MIYLSGLASLFVQFVIGVIDYLALNTEVSPNNELLKDLLKVELFVQVIEFIFYVWLILYFSKVSQRITTFRYLDWAITTPLMLITLSAFLHHEGTAPSRLSDFLSNHTGSITIIVLLDRRTFKMGAFGARILYDSAAFRPWEVINGRLWRPFIIFTGLNAAMLLFGFIGELGYLTPSVSTALGFIPFALNFKYIKDTFLPSSDDKSKNMLYYWFVFFWSLYGVFALTTYTIKNTGYNILDIFAKNFFGLLLAYVVWSTSNAEKAMVVNGSREP